MARSLRSRPKKQPRQRTALLLVRLKPEERLKINEHARRLGITNSEFVRRAALNIPLPNQRRAKAFPEINVNTYREVASISNRLTLLAQQSRGIREERSPAIRELRTAIDKLQPLMKEIALTLLKADVRAAK